MPKIVPTFTQQSRSRGGRAVVGSQRARREEEYTPGTESYHNYQAAADPTYQIPEGFEMSPNGRVRTAVSGWEKLRDHPLFPLLMAAGIGTGGTALAGGFGGAAGAAGATGAAGTTASIAGPGVTAGLGGLGGATAGGLGAGAATAGTGGAMASLAKWLPLISQGTSLAGGMYAGRQAQKSRDKASGGIDFAAMAPLIQALIQQQQQQSAENYAAQKTKAAANQPMEAAIRQLAMSLMPR